MASVRDWVEERIEREEFEREIVGDEAYLVVYKEQKEHLVMRHRIPEENFYAMLQPVFRNLRSADDLTKESLNEASKPDPDAMSELAQADWGFEKFIDHWAEEGYLDWYEEDTME
jgi:hypothetical protein